IRRHVVPKLTEHSASGGNPLLISRTLSVNAPARCKLPDKGWPYKASLTERGGPMKVLAVTLPPQIGRTGTRGAANELLRFRWGHMSSVMQAGEDLGATLQCVRRVLR